MTQSSGQGIRFTGIVAAQSGVTAADHGKIGTCGLGSGQQVASNFRVKRLRCGQGQTARVGQNVEDRGTACEFSLKRGDRPFGKNRQIIDGLRAGGIIIQDHQRASGRRQLLLDSGQQTLGPEWWQGCQERGLIDNFG